VKYGTPWEFISGAMLIEWLANLCKPDRLSYSPPAIEHPYFVDLLTQYLPNYRQFEFQSALPSIQNTSETTIQYLPLQLYLTFRNPLVHAFSMLPEKIDSSYVPPRNPTSYKQLTRPCSIVICHRNPTSTRWDGEHLALVEGDRCQLRSPDFLEDLDDLITNMFSDAQVNTELADRIRNRFHQRRPVDTLGELTILRRGPRENL
jgi:hypothetical protein